MQHCRGKKQQLESNSGEDGKNLDKIYGMRDKRLAGLYGYDPFTCNIFDSAGRGRGLNSWFI